MSIERTYYTILGIDLSNYKTDKYKEWCWNDDEAFYNRWFGCPSFEVPSLFDIDGDLYLGCVLSKNDEYEHQTTMVTLSELYSFDTNNTIGEALAELIKTGIINEEAETEDFAIISFVKFS